MSAQTETRPRFDAATLEVLWTRLISTVNEAAKALTRAAFSTLVNESNDFACIVTDVRGQSLVQNTDSIPSFIGALPVTVKHFIKEFGLDGLRPGDVLTTNNPWVATGHLNDVTVAKPIFRSGRIVAFAASTAHVPDIGGKIRSVEPREVFEEGFHIPPLKMLSEGRPNQTLFTLLRAAVRTPDQTVGDIYAQLTGLDLMERRVLELMDEYGLETLTELSDEIHGRCERAMRAAVRAVPDGVYSFGFETDGLEEPITYRVKVTIAGDEVTVDYTGTSPQVDRALNCTTTYTFAMTAYALKAALLPTLPNNEGVFRSIRLIAPEGSIVNPRFPAAVGGRVGTGHYLPVLIFGALSRVMPERVMAAAGSPLWSIIQTGVREGGGTYANVFFFNGGMGALHNRDGQSTYCWPSNISGVPVEMMERNSPLFVRHKRLRPDSGGRGRHRGGLGQEILFENESKTPIAIIFLAERTKNPAPGMFGGEAGALGRVEIDDKVIDNRLLYVLKEGQTVRLCTPGGGGFGPPGERNRELAAGDRLMGYASL
ncbi:MAG: hydantoinase B/oxoprolinase family protein [Proteobacteria bacterium]|nr:hydantoinase B/oxoprolinase family protein [Pseudomonadota bacterium]